MTDTTLRNVPTTSSAVSVPARIVLIIGALAIAGFASLFVPLGM